MSDETDPELGLAELLQSLGSELRRANEAAVEGRRTTLAWSEATVEVELEVRVTAKGGIRFAVLGIGAEGGADRGTGRTVRAAVRCVPFSALEDKLGRDRARALAAGWVP